MVDMTYIWAAWISSMMAAVLVHPSRPNACLTAAVDRRGMRLNMVTITVISCCTGKGSERDVNGSKVRLTFPHTLHVTAEQSCPWNKSTMQLRLRTKCCSQAAVPCIYTVQC